MSNTLPKQFQHPYTFNKEYEKSVAYFCMEFAIDQSLKIYSGGLGFLAGSHMRSAYELKQNVIGIGILWKYGYYDQTRKDDLTLSVQFREKIYHFLEDTGIKYSIEIDGHPVWIKVWFLPPTTFGSVPLFLLSTDLPENDYLARSTTFKLYDSDPNAKIAQSMVLGIGGAKLLDELNYNPDLYHFNEAHALSAVFYWMKKYNNIETIKEKLVFTTHTPEEAGNEKHDINVLNKLGFFNGIPVDEVKKMTKIEGNEFNHSLVTLRFSHQANGVSKLHGEVSREMWKNYTDICDITHVTNGQNKSYWADNWLEDARQNNDLQALAARKKRLKEKLFAIVADQTGKLFKPEVLTIVWARRFAEYKRPDLITRNLEHLQSILNNPAKPVQLIFAGKPYPMDYNAIHTFNHLVELGKTNKNIAVLIGYELELSRTLKCGSDLWLNNPRVTREASGTSGMTASMNGCINISTNDGWVREYHDMHPNDSFVLPIVSHEIPKYEQDEQDLNNLYKMLEDTVIPMYYDTPDKWAQMRINTMNTVYPFFGSNRMAEEYYTKVYNLD